MLYKNNFLNTPASPTGETQVSKVKDAPPPPTPIDTVMLDSQITAIIQQYPQLEISVAYQDLKTSANLFTGVPEPYDAASIVKIVTAALFLREVQNGKYTLDTVVEGAPAHEQLRKMIEDSDNPSWHAFNRLLTKPAQDEFAKQAGLTDFKAEGNTTTAKDIALLLSKIYKNELLNKQYTELLLTLMEKASERQYIPAAIPDGAQVYHKAGYLSDRVHDAAIIDDGERPYVLVIFTKSEGAYDFELGRRIIHEITQKVWDGHLGAAG